MQAVPFLLKSKITIPRRSKPAILRPRLLDKLNEGTACSLTLVSAPPGFGKTTLLAQWGMNAPKTAWLALDAEDNDPNRFFTYFLAALRQVVALREEIESGLRSSGPLPLQAILDLILSDLEAAPPDPFSMILDDYHVIHAQPIHDALAYLLDHQQAQMHWILATRADPPIPLGRLRAQGELFELRAEDLRFTREETTDFLSHLTGLEMTPGQIHTLEARTEGWIAGLQLAALSMQGRQDLDGYIQALSGSHRFILDYLTEEVLNRQEKSIQRFLLHTSILERLSGPLCDAVLENRESRKDNKEVASISTLHSASILDDLEHSNLFIIPLDDERRWYRYHHLFEELLRARLEQEEPGILSELHLRASTWYDQNGYPVEAVQHALAGGSAERAAELIERYGHERWSLSDLEFLKLIHRLPIEMLRSRPKLGIYHVWMLILDGKLRPAWDFVKEMMKHISDDVADPEMKGVRVFSELLTIYVPAMLGEPATGELPEREALDFVSEHHLGMRNTADVVYAMLLSWRGEFEPAAEILLNCARRDIQAHGTTAVPISISYLARLRLLQGKPRQAEALCREYLQYVNEQGKWKFYAAGELDIILGEALLAQNRLEEAEGHIREGIRTDEAWQIPTADALGLTNLARIRMAQGKLQEASEILQRLEQHIQGKVLLQDMEDAVYALKIRLQLSTGQLADAVKWADAYQPALRLDFLHEAENLALARVKMAQGSYEQALTLLNQLSEAAEAGNRFGRLLEILLLKALSLAALDRLSPSYQALETCLALGEPEGILRVFLNEGEPLRKLLSTYLHNPQAVYGDYAKSLLAAGKPGHSAGAVNLPEGLIEPLTPRELEVLRLICAGDSNQAIAEKLSITVASVKKHTGNIYGKLGVTSRTQAIVQARLFGLVS